VVYNRKIREAEEENEVVLKHVRVWKS